MSLSPNPTQNTSFLSVQRKREALWNVLQPGDPYDIRKSMIAKIPFDKKTFMGDHLELVCLFQAAQIERLSQFLDDFKIKYRQIQRIKLDRHSYEVQIQQLTHRLAEEAVFREQNQKLKQFIKNQNLSKQGVEDSIKTKYEKLLVQAKGFEQQNNALRQRNQQLGMQISNFDSKYEVLKKSVYSDYQQKMKQSQNTSMSTQLEITALKSQYESEVQRLFLENKRIKQLNDQKNYEIESWQSKYKMLEQQILKSSPRSETKIAEYETRFVIFGQQIDRLNLVIKEISSKYEISEQRNREYEKQYDALSKEMMLLQSKVHPEEDHRSQFLKRITELESENRKMLESGKLSKEYETKLRQANEQISRLEGQLRMELQNVHILRQEVQRYQYEQSRIKLLEKQLYEQRQSTENHDLKLKLARDQNQVALLKQQVQRLREELSRKNGLQTAQRNLSIENQTLQSKISDWERKYQMVVQECQMKITQKVSEYQSRLENINRTKGFEYQNKASMLQNQLQRISDLLRKKQEEVEHYQKQIRELEYSITNKYELDTSRKVQTYETTIQALKRDNDQLLRKVRQLEPLQRKINEFENKSTITSQQIQRLTQQIRSRQNDIQNLRRQIRQQQIAIVQKFEMDTSRKMGNYENILNDLNRQNQDLKRKYAEMQNKAALLSQEIERLTSNLRQSQSRIVQYEQEIQRLQKFSKQTEVNIARKYEMELNQKIQNYENFISKNQHEIEESKRRIFDLENNNRRLVEYENQLKSAGQEIQRTNSILRKKQEEFLHLETNHRNLIREFEDLGRKHNQLQALVRNKFQVEATRTISSLEQNLTHLKRENDDLKRITQQYELRMKKQGGDVEGLSLNLRNLAQQNEGLKRQIVELENVYRNKLEVEVAGKYRSYESNITEIKLQLENVVRENNELKRVIQQAEQNNIRLNQENEQLRRRFQQDFGEASKTIYDYELKIKQFQSQNQILKRKIVELQTVIRQKYQIEASRRISSLDQNLANAAKENEELRRRLQMVTRQLDDTRRTTQRMQKDHQELIRRLRQFGEINKKVVESQNKISLLNQQLKIRSDNLTKADAFIKEITQKLQNAERNMSHSQSSIQQFQMEVKNQIAKYEQNIQVLNHQNVQLKRKLVILDDLNRKIVEYENKIMILNQQLERVNINLKNQIQKSSHFENAFKNQGNQNENLRRNLIEIQNTVTQKYEVEATRTIRTLEQNFDGAQKENTQLKKVLQEYEQKLNVQNVDIQKLNLNLKNSTQEINLLRNQLKQTEINIVRKYETEVNSRHSVYEQNLSGLSKENEGLKRRLAEIQQEIQKLVRKINELQHENENIRRQAKQGEAQVIQKFNYETAQQVNIYKQQITQIESQWRNAQKQNEELHRKLNDFGGEANRKIIHSQEELKRASLQIQKLISKVREYENKIREISTENEGLKRQLKDTELGLTQKWESQLRSRVTNYQQVISNLQRNQSELENTIKNMSRSFQDKQINLNSQTTKHIAELQNKIALLSQQLQHVTQNFRQRGEEIQRMRQQIERLNNTLRLKVEELKHYETQITKFKSFTESQFSQLQSNYSLITRQNQNYKKHLIEYETSIKKLYGQFQRLQNIINDLKRERQSLFEKNFALSTEIDRLLSENKDLEVQVEDVRLRLTDESALSRRVNEHLGLMSLRKRVKDKEREVEDVRRSSLAPFKLDRSRPKMESI